jgi:hypothetical protein
MNRYDHGGYCCGMKHLAGFDACFVEPYFTQTRVDKRHREVLRDLTLKLEAENGYFGGGTLVEVVLQNYQNDVWGNVLLNRGFKLVNSFFNNNSGNNVYIYHKAPPTKPTGEVHRPYKQHEELSENPEVVGDWQRPQSTTPPPRYAPMTPPDVHIEDLPWEPTQPVNAARVRRG